MRLSLGEKIFNIGNIVFLSVLGLIALYPFVFVLSSSVSDPNAIMQGRVWLYPVGFTLEAYANILSRSDIWMGYANSVFFAVVGTAVNLVFTIAGAYPLSKNRLRGRMALTLFVAFTMWFTPGIVPLFLTFRNYNLLDTRSALIFGFAVSAFNFFILRTNFASVPDSLEESAKLDGANDFTILTKIYLPLSMAALATVGLFYFVGRWNAFFWSMILISSDNIVPLPVLLNQLLIVADWGADAGDVVTSAETLIHATIMVAIIPMLLAFPILQRYFVKGVMIGSVKG